MERVVVVTIDESSWKLKKSFADSNVMMAVNEVLEFLCNKHYGSFLLHLDTYVRALVERMAALN